jgi:hypothetical protein
LFVDEAHSIGGLGYILLQFSIFAMADFSSSSRGRGVCDYFNIGSSEVDILMESWELSQKHSEEMVAILQPIKP